MPQSVVNIPTKKSISKDFYYPDGAGSALKRVCEPRRHSEPCDGAVASFNISVNFELGRGPAPTVTGSYKAIGRSDYTLNRSESCIPLRVSSCLV